MFRLHTVYQSLSLPSLHKHDMIHTIHYLLGIPEVYHNLSDVQREILQGMLKFSDDQSRNLCVFYCPLFSTVLS